MHCDALTSEGVLQVTGKALQAGGCMLQCFAAFAGNGGYGRFCSLADAFYAMCLREGFRPVVCAKDLADGAVHAMLTVEGDALEGELSRVDALYARGVRMMGFVWNTPSSAGFPNFPDYAGFLAGHVPPSLRERNRGLTPFGADVLARMGELGMIADVSHGSDRLFREVAAAGHPFVASHSNAASVCAWARNLADEQIAAVARCGGVVGLNFCADFLGGGAKGTEQREAILAHARAIVRAGGEDVLAVGSDFDGAPPNPYVRGPGDMPRLFDDFSRAFGARIAEKIARGNFLRVFAEVCG